MADTTPLHTLLELAEKAVEQQTKRMGIAQRAHQENQQKLALLLQYQRDYEQQYERCMANGLGMLHHQNFREFMLKLDDAIHGQQLLIEQTEARLATERNAWQAAERKRMSYHTLKQREHERQTQHAYKQEQKLNDEFATRMINQRLNHHD